MSDTCGWYAALYLVYEIINADGCRFRVAAIFILPEDITVDLINIEMR